MNQLIVIDWRLTKSDDYGDFYVSEQVADWPEVFPLSLSLSLSVVGWHGGREERAQ